MNREAIIQAAIDADAAKQTHLSGVLTYLFTEHDLVKFAEIIRSATKEEDAMICNGLQWEGNEDAYLQSAWEVGTLDCAEAIRGSK